MSASPESFALVLTTAGTEDEALALARAIVDQRLAACVNVTGPVRSIYRWRGEVRSDEERLLVIKTTVARFDALRDAILRLHSYETPEIVLIPIERGSDAYLRWILDETSDPGA